MIGSLAGSAISIGGGLLGAKALNKGYRQQQEIFNNRMNDVRAHRDAVYYQDPSQSAENQAAVANAQQVMDEANKRARLQASLPVAPMRAQLAKAQSAATVGNMMQQAAVNGQSRKDTAWSSADSQLDTFTKYLADSKLAQAAGKAKSIQDAAGELASAANKMPW